MCKHLFVFVAVCVSHVFSLTPSCLFYLIPVSLVLFYLISF